MAELLRQSTPYYAPGAASPRHDPTYVEKVADALLAQRGQRVHLEAVVGGDPWCVHEAVECLRRLGWDIRGTRGSPGYVFVKWLRPPRWTRLDSVYREHTAAIVLCPKRVRHMAPAAGQLEF